MPIRWRLLTRHSVYSLDQASWILNSYRRGWAIEQLFRMLKTGGFDL